MTHIKILIGVFYLSLVSCTKGQTVTFDNFKQRLFLNANIDKLDTSLITFYKQDKSLKYELGPIWTSTMEGIERGHFFYFVHHPLFSFPFRQGNIELDSYKTDTTEILTNIMLRLEFAEKSEAEKAYSFFTDNFSKLSTRKKLFNEDDSKTAIFINERSINLKKIMIEEGSNDDEMPNAYTIVIGFGIGTDIDDNDTDL